MGIFPIGGANLPGRIKRKRKPAAWTSYAVFVFGCLVAFAIFRLPREASNEGLDDSWRGVLGYAHDRGWQHGSDIVFTYGPLGFLTNFKIASGQIWLRILFEAALSLGAGFGLCRLAARMNRFFQIFLPGFFVLASATILEGRDDLLFETVFTAWGLLCFMDTGKLLTVDVLCLVAFAVLGALAKFTWLLTGGLTVAFAVAGIWLRGNRKLAVGALAAYCVAFLACWVLLDQKLSGLAGFVRNSMAISDGWNASMVVSQVGEKAGWLGSLSVLAAALFVVTTGSFCGRMNDLPQNAPRRAMLFLWMGGLLFMEWKHGIVRADPTHTTLFMVFIPTATLIFEATRPGGKTLARLAQSAGLAAAALSLILLQLYFPGFCQESARETVEGMGYNLSALASPFAYASRCARAFEYAENNAQIPQFSSIIGYGPVDLFGCFQQIVFYNHWNYHPRPVFQNYSVYNRALSELNERFYAGPDAPEFVVYLTWPIDGRFTPLEDAFTLRQLLINYDLAFDGESCLLLRRARAESPQLTLLKDAHTRPGQKISMQEYGDTNLWLEIDIKPALLGRLAQFGYKLLPPYLQVEPSNSNFATNYIAPAPMLATGFLASPLIQSVADAANIYTGRPVARPAAYSVLLAPGESSFWQNDIHYRIYKIENSIGHRSQ